MRDVSEIPKGPGIYLVHTASGSWWLLELDGPPTCARVPGPGAPSYPQDGTRVSLQRLGDGWRVGECGHLTFLDSIEPAAEIKRTTSRILGIIAFHIEPV